MARRSADAIARNVEQTRLKKQENRARVSAYKVRMQCEDCPSAILWPACALHLDHRPGEDKVAEVSKMLGCSWENIAAEIRKCSVVCAGHHAIRTWHRAQGIALECDVFPSSP